MSKHQTAENFICPKCSAHYKLVRVPASADSRNLPLHCKICQEEFASSGDGNIFKYFLVGSARAPARQAARARDTSKSIQS